ncbi:MAG: TOTE conflict system archaeo-eukaryotic primase domain-containing protein, partial [Acidimicrobiales bacterium]
MRPACWCPSASVAARPVAWPTRSSPVRSPGPSAEVPAGEGPPLRAQRAPLRGRRRRRSGAPGLRRPGRAAPPARHRPARPARPRLGPHQASAVGHLRQRSRHHRRHVVPVLRADRLVPVQQDARALRETCRRLALPVVLERSRSGEGGHLWFFFE